MVAIMQRFEWDESKRLANARKHAIDFEDAISIFDGRFLTVEDDRFEYEESRFISFGLVMGVVIAVIHTERGETTRIISARRASVNEQKRYFQDFSD